MLRSPATVLPPCRPASRPRWRRKDVCALYVVPGLIDLHMHVIGYEAQSRWTRMPFQPARPRSWMLGGVVEDFCRTVFENAGAGPYSVHGTTEAAAPHNCSGPGPNPRQNLIRSTRPSKNPPRGAVSQMLNLRELSAGSTAFQKVKEFSNLGPCRLPAFTSQCRE